MKTLLQMIIIKPTTTMKGFTTKKANHYIRNIYNKSKRNR